MKRLAVLMLASVPAAAQSVPPAAPEPQTAHIRQIEQDVAVIPMGKGELPRHFDLASVMRILDVPGLSVAVFDNYRILWAKGYGVAEAGGATPVTTHTLFQAGDISRGVAAAATLALVEQGRLSLDGNVNDALRTWKVPDNEFTTTEKVTLRRLLLNSAGLPAPPFTGYAPADHGAHSDAAPVPTVLQLLDGEKPARSGPVRVEMVPGSKFQYSDGGVTVEQLLDMDAAYLPFPRLVSELVFRKAGMNESTFEQPLPSSKAAVAAVGTRLDGRSIVGKRHVYPDMAAHGLWTTPSDLARFAIEIANSAKGRSNRVLSREMTLQMLQPQLEGRARCLGFFLNDPDDPASLLLDGATDGFQATFVASHATGRGFVIMANSDLGLGVAAYLGPAILREYGWKFPTPRVQAELIVRAIASERSLDAALDWFRELKGSGSTEIGYGSYTLNGVGSLMLLRKDAPAAIKVLKMNTELYPQSSGAYGLLGDAYLSTGATDLAIANYERAVELNPGNQSAAEQLKRLRQP